MIRKNFTFKGRINRSMSIFGIFTPVGFMYILFLVISASIMVNIGLEKVIAILYLPFWALCICYSVRRAHDLNKSGAYALLILIPFIGIYWGLRLLFVKGTEGPNDYGPEYKESFTDAWKDFGKSIARRIDKLIP